MWKYEGQGKRLTYQQHSVSTLYTEYSWQILFADLNLVSIWENQVPTICVVREPFIYLYIYLQQARLSGTAKQQIWK